MLYGPTNEEMITGLFPTDVKATATSAHALLIQWKFRDEVGRFGVMRGRRILMKDVTAST